MKTLRMFAVGLMLTALFAISAFAQVAGAKPAASNKIVVINTYAFDGKEGIAKYVGAMNTLETEFKPVQTDIETTTAKLQTVAKELQGLQEQAAKPNSPISQATVQAKSDEGQRLQIDLKRKQEDAKARFEKRRQALLAPLMQDISKAVQEFSKKNGYLMILDVGKMVDDGSLIALDENVDVTKAFITFYNARPAGTASTVAPK